jgi:hypothetical protein
MKQKTIQLLGLLSGITVAILGGGEAQAIPLVDSFDENHSASSTVIGGPDNSQGFGVGSDTDTTGISIIGNDPADSTTNGQRDVFIRNEVTNSPPGASPTSTSFTTINSNQLLLSTSPATGADLESTFSLTYDGVDGFRQPEAGLGFDTGGLPAVDVRTGVNGLTNNVFALRGFSTNTKVSIDVDLFDSTDEQISAGETGATDDPSTSTFDESELITLDSSDNGTVFIALSASDITEPPGIDTNARFFEHNPSFDFTQVTGIRFTASIQGSNSVLVDSMGFERIPFEAESSIGIALLGAWGIWKRWKKQGEETAEESNVG